MSEEKTTQKFSIPRVLAGVFGQSVKHLPLFLPVAAVLVGGAHYFVHTPSLFALTGLPQLLGPWARFTVPYVELLPYALAQGLIIRVCFNDLTGRGAGVLIAFAATAATSLWLILYAYASTILISLAAILLVAPGLIAAVRFSVGPACIVVEGAGFSGGFRRSMELTQGEIGWSIFALQMLSALSNVVALYFARVALSGRAEFLSPTTLNDPRYTLVECVVWTLSAVLNAAGIAAIYVELLRIKEGGDSQALAATFE